MPLNFIVKAAIQIGLSAASMALQMSRKIEGPRLDNLKFTSGDYGASLLSIWGTRKIEAPIFWAESLREVKRRRKTKGGKYNEYTYYGTWAVALAGHEISSVRRIWFDAHLVYDVSGSGPITPFDFGGTGSISDFITIYLGTETQEPDPRMQATVEAEFGEGSCPAYRGTSYVVFKDIPLEKLGNRIPQISVEVASGNIYPTEAVTLDSGQSGSFVFSADFGFWAVGDILAYTVGDTFTRTSIYENDFTPNLFSSQSGFTVRADGTILGIVGPNDVKAYPLGGPSYTFFDGTGLGQLRVFGLTDNEGDEHWITSPHYTGEPFFFDGVAYDPTTLWGENWTAKFFFVDSANSIWAVGKGTVTTECYFRRLTGMGLSGITVTGLPANGGGAYAVHYEDASHDHFVLGWNSNLYIIDRLTGAITASYLSIDEPPNQAEWLAVRPGMSSIWAGFEEISLADLSTIRLLDARDWGHAAANKPTVYDPINHALITSSATILTWNFLDRVGTTGVTLASIANDLSVMAGVTEYDFSDLTQVVQGYSVAKGAASSGIEPLLDFFDSDIRPHDFSIQGKRRTGTSVGSALTSQFVRDGDAPRYAIKMRQAPELPRAIIVNYADIDAEQQPNSVRADRPLDATGAVGERTLDLTTLAGDKDEIRNLTDRYFRRLWNERREVSLALTAQNLKLEPGDVWTLDFDGDEADYRCVKLTFRADDVQQTEWKYDSPGLALLNNGTGAAFDGRDEAVMVLPILSKGFFLDIPYVSDEDDQPSPTLYIAAAPYAAGSWPGAVMYQSVGGEYTEEIGSVPSSSSATWGYVDDILPDVNPNVWDRGSVVTVVLQNGALTGCTEAQIDANPSLNQALFGDEIVNFTTATLVAALTYEISGFKRGRRGTEWACSAHASGEAFLLLDTVADVAMGLSEVGTNLSFKAITSSRSTGFPVNIEPFSGASLKPYAPCHLEAVKGGSGDWVMTWARRTRVGGAWTSGTSIPLSEDSEEYEVEILDGGGTVLHTYTGLTSPTVTYSSADQTTYAGGSVAVGDLHFRVYQISAQVNRGFAASADA